MKARVHEKTGNFCLQSCAGHLIRLVFALPEFFCLRNWPLNSGLILFRTKRSHWFLFLCFFVFLITPNQKSSVFLLFFLLHLPEVLRDLQRKRLDLDLDGPDLSKRFYEAKEPQLVAEKSC